MRTCADCSVAIEHRHRNCVCCESCAEIRDRACKQRYEKQHAVGRRVVVDGHLECRLCKRLLPVESKFHRDRTTSYGYESRCKECVAKRNSEYNSRPEVMARKRVQKREMYKIPEVRARHRESALRNTLANPARRLLYSAQDRAAKKGIAFTITIADIVVPELCPLLGVPLKLKQGSKGPSPFSPTLDRLDPRVGYVPGNVWVISYRANAIKNDATPDELELIAAGVRSRLRLVLEAEDKKCSGIK